VRPDMASTTDDSELATLVQAAAAGDSEAWEDLVGRFSGLVWSIARAHRLNPATTADVSQTVWLRLVENLDRIRQPDRLGAWLASVTRRECLRVLRGSDREVPAPSNPESDPRSAREVDADLLTLERNAALRGALDRLPPQWRSLMRVMMADPPLSYQEIAAGLRIPIGSIGPTRQRCLERLRKAPELIRVA
jgi:RNA polymerase sigma factor (sigma-70 family)